jgi:hypothetical protein
METNSMMKRKITYLNQEVHSLHRTNRHYWQEETPTTRERSLYQIRQDRLEEIRIELVRLCALPSAEIGIDCVDKSAVN